MFLFQPFSKHVQEILFKVGMFLAFLIFLIAISAKNSIAYELPGCIFLNVTGIPCPACGGTRAFLALLNGNIWLSFLFNPVVLYGSIIYLSFMISWFLHGLIRSIPTISLCAIHFLLAPVILFLNWMIRLAALYG